MSMRGSQLLRTKHGTGACRTRTSLEQSSVAPLNNISVSRVVLGFTK